MCTQPAMTGPPHCTKHVTKHTVLIGGSISSVVQENSLSCAFQNFKMRLSVAYWQFSLPECSNWCSHVQNSGYFSSEESPIGTLREPISFNFLLGESGWRAKQQQIYRRLQVSVFLVDTRVIPQVIRASQL